MVPMVLTNTSRLQQRTHQPDADLPVESERLDDRLDQMSRPPGKAVIELLGGGRVFQLRITGQEPEKDGGAQNDRAGRFRKEAARSHI